MAFDETRKFDIIDDLKIEKFIKDAMAARGAKWQRKGCDIFYFEGDDPSDKEFIAQLEDEDHPIVGIPWPYDAKHITNFDPQTAILLCREILKLREENRELKEEVEYLEQENDGIADTAEYFAVRYINSKYRSY